MLKLPITPHNQRLPIFRIWMRWKDPFSRRRNVHWQPRANRDQSASEISPPTSSCCQSCGEAFEVEAIPLAAQPWLVRYYPSICNQWRKLQNAESSTQSPLPLICWQNTAKDRASQSKVADCWSSSCTQPLAPSLAKAFDRVSQGLIECKKEHCQHYLQGII